MLSSNSYKYVAELKNKHEFATERAQFVNISVKWKSSEHKTTLVTQRTCERYYFLLILVHSAPGYLDRRNNIRKTWALDNTLKWPRWKTVFLVGQTRLSGESESLLKEDEDFGDLVRGAFYEDYQNQTYKIQMGFEWAVKYCEFSFLLKADDDVFLDPVGVISFLNEPTTPHKELYTGNLNTGTKPFRHEGGRWSVTYEEYSEKFYHDYCSGFAFILSYDVVALFVEVLDLVPIFKIDDVYVGLLAKETGIRGLHTAGFELTVPQLANLCIPFNNTLARHGTLGECLIEIYNRSAKKRMYFT